MEYDIKKDHSDMTPAQVEALPMQQRCWFYVMPWNNAISPQTVREWAREIGWFAFREYDDAEARAIAEAERLFAFVSARVEGAERAETAERAWTELGARAQGERDELQLILNDAIAERDALWAENEVLATERKALREAGKTLQRLQFILGGRSGDTSDCDEAALRINVDRALALLGEKLPPIVSVLAARHGRAGDA